MEYEKMVKIVNCIIENEVERVRECSEIMFQTGNKEQNELCERANSLRKLLDGILNAEQRDILDKLDSAMTSEWVGFCDFYFRKGVLAGLTNLEYLKELNAESIL